MRSVKLEKFCWDEMNCIVLFHVADKLSLSLIEEGREENRQDKSIYGEIMWPNLDEEQ